MYKISLKNQKLLISPVFIFFIHARSKDDKEMHSIGSEKIFLIKKRAENRKKESNQKCRRRIIFPRARTQNCGKTRILQLDSREGN